MKKNKKNRFYRYFRLVIFYFFFSTIGAVILGRFFPIGTSSYMFLNKVDNLLAGEIKPINQAWIGLGSIPQNMQLAVIASEDQKFPDHFGFDIESIEKALKENTRRKRIRGASTITQQVARNLFLWPGKSYFRKGLEAYFTILLEVFWSKERILEVYLNIAEFGENIYGVESAARILFKKPATKLNINQCALLASVLPNPKRFKANRPSPYTQRRSSWIINQMNQLGGKAYLENL